MGLFKGIVRQFRLKPKHLNCDIRPFLIGPGRTERIKKMKKKTVSLQGRIQNV